MSWTRPTSVRSILLVCVLTIASAACTSSPESDPFEVDDAPQEVLPEIAAQRPVTDEDIRNADPSQLPPGVTIIRFDEILELGDLGWAWAIASDHGDIDELRRVLQKGIDVNTLIGGDYRDPGSPQTGHYTTALIEATRHRRGKIVEFLLEQGADPKIHEHDYEDGVDSGRGGDTALHKAVEAGNGHLVTKFLELGVPVDSPGYDGWTPLGKAVAMDSPGLTKLLLENGADPNAKLVANTPITELFKDGSSSAASLIHRATRGEPLELPAEASSN